MLPPDTAKPAGASPGAPRFPQIWKRSANRFDDPDELVAPVAALASKADQLADPGAESLGLLGVVCGRALRWRQLGAGEGLLRGLTAGPGLASRGGRGDRRERGGRGVGRAG